MRFIDRMRSLFRANKKTAADDLLDSVSRQLHTQQQQLYARIEAAASGSGGRVEATVEYIIRDRSGAELQTEWQDPDYITGDDIQATDGYRSLQQAVNAAGIRMKLVEEQIEEVDDEDRVRFIVRFSGWAK